MTLLSGASTELSAAVIVTVPVLVLEPAAIVSVLSVLSVKSDEVAGDTAAAETVRVMSWLDSALRVAVTVVEPPFSEIEAEPSVPVRRWACTLVVDNGEGHDRRVRRRRCRPTPSR